MLHGVGDRIVLKLESQTTTSSGLIVSQTKPNRGTVVSVGEDVDISVEEKFVVLFKANAGEEVELNGEKFLIIREDDVLAVISE